MRKGMFIIPFFATAACAVGFLAYSPSAAAAIDGENGPIVYIDNQVPTENENSVNPEDRGVILQEETVSQVITTGPDGTNEQVAATEDDTITAAGISPPTAEGNYDIAYGVESTTDCAKYEKTCAVVNKVTTDGDGNVVEGQDLLTNLDSLVNGTKWFPSKSWVNNLSYSPDGETVLATQYSYQIDNPKAAIVAIDNESGTPTTIVGPSSDVYINAGYADNGTIYYSKTTWFNTDIWYILPGETTSQQLTTTKNMSEYFLDVSPDNKSVLVADVTSSLDCLSAYGMLANRESSSYNHCKFYLISTVDGSATPLSELKDEMFIPAYFSPDNSSLIGTVYGQQNESKSFKKNNVTPLYTATFNLTTKLFAKVTDRVGIEQWAPLAQATPNPTPESPAVTVASVPTVATGAKLAYTGSSIAVYIAVLIVLAVVSSASILVGAKSYKN
ncbi:hypothetical protein KC871_00045 [Candidatus Saccharibacteria bacterium]|nr:hypothetical protein [Candidatus Saccharibacteria bacterium]MCB9817177.1 hypothetical protein [Candidatus Nomurabacteria bacterium]